MLVGYFDESGTTDKDHLALVGGFVADTVIWSRIEIRWRRKLHQFGLSHYHAVECEHALGEFAAMSRGIRDSLTNYFSKLIAEIEGQGFASGVVRKDWHDYAPLELKAMHWDDPIYFSVVMTFQQISKWSASKMNSEPVAVVFARQEQYGKRSAEIHQMFFEASEKWPGIGSLSVSDPKDSVQLQVADLLCYEMVKFVTNGNNPRRTALNNLDEGSGRPGFSFILHDRETLPHIISK